MEIKATLKESWELVEVIKELTEHEKIAISFGADIDIYRGGDELDIEISIVRD